MNENITNDIATKLLAQENLMINRAPVRTASFDVKNRILTLPQWKDMTPELEDMLKAHEVGHAIYTDTAQFDALVKANKQIPFGYLNVIEDVRIERLMKKAYPGLRRVFNTGYRQIAERDFFELKGRDPNTLIFIDRINIHFKVGLPAGIRFTVAEKYLVEKIERNESLFEVVELARAVLEMTKRDQERKKLFRENDADFKKMLEEAAEMEMETGFDDHDWDAGAPVEEEDDDEEGAGFGAGDQASFGEEEVKVDVESLDQDIFTSVTSNALEKQLADSADVNTQYLYLSLPDTTQPYFKETLVDYKTVLKETSDLLAAASRDYETTYGRAAQEYETFRSETNRVVSYLVKEFEMKKAATAYKRQHVAKTGVLDVAKLASYKIREDLFRQVTITKDGQKHGMIFTIDWSGSMDGYLHETVKQLISLVTFCYRTKIPFEVYAFSDQNGHLSYEQRHQMYSRTASYDVQKNTLSLLNKYFKMIQFFSHKMTLVEFNRMCRNVFIMSFSHLLRDGARCDSYVSVKYQLNGTPLNEAMLWLYDRVGEFKKINQVEKATLIKLTDGDGGGINTYFNEEGQEVYVGEFSYTKEGLRKRMVIYLRDSVTQKVYRFNREETTNIICKMIEDRHDCSVVGYHVTGRGRRELTYHLERYGVEASLRYDLAMAIRKGFNDEQFYSLPTYGHTEMFMLPNNIKVDDTQLSESLADMSSGQIAKKFGKMMGGKRTSRVLLNKFVAAVA